MANRVIQRFLNTALSSGSGILRAQALAAKEKEERQRQKNQDAINALLGYTKIDQAKTAMERDRAEIDKLNKPAIPKQMINVPGYGNLPIDEAYHYLPKEDKAPTAEDIEAKARALNIKNKIPFFDRKEDNGITPIQQANLKLNITKAVSDYGSSLKGKDPDSLFNAIVPSKEPLPANTPNSLNDYLPQNPANALGGQGQTQQRQPVNMTPEEQDIHDKLAKMPPNVQLDWDAIQRDHPNSDINYIRKSLGR